MEEVRLGKIKEVLKELPLPHYRTLEFLMRHLLRMAAHSSQTNMHARNLAIVWAPNLLRSKEIEASGFNGTAAFMEVRVQSIVVEFILTHVEQLFGDAPLHGSESPRRSLLLGAGLAGAGQAPPYHVPATLSQGDGPPPIRPYHTIIELSEHRRKGSLKAKKWRSIFHLGRSSHEAKRKLVKAEEKEPGGSKLSLRPAKSMDSLSSSPSGEEPRLGQGLAAKQPPQRRESFDTCPSLPPALGSCQELDKSLEEPPKGAEEPEGEGSTKSEPTTPRAARASLLAPGRSPKAGGSRAQRCAGVHISGPFSVTVPFHITSNLSRLTRGLPCPALAQLAAGGEPPAGTSTPTRCPAGDPESPEPRGGNRRLSAPAGSGAAPGGHQALPPPSPPAGDAEGARLSLELRDSFAFLDSPEEPWLEGDGDGETLPWLLPLGTGPGHGEGCPAVEEGMESGCMNPAEPRAEQPGSYLSIEECMDEEMFFMAPGGSDPEDCPGDTDSDLFLSAHDELSPLLASQEPCGQPPGEAVPPQSLAQPRAAGAVPGAGAAAPGLAEGEGGHLGDPSEVPGKGGAGEGTTDSSSEPSRTESSAGAGGAEDDAGAKLVLATAAGEDEEDGASPGAPGEAEPQPVLGPPPAPSPEEPPGPGCAPEVAPEVAPEAVPEAAPEAVPEAAPEAVPEAVPEAAPEVVPEAAPEVVPEAAPEVAPEAVPEVVPEAAPEAVPEVAPEAVPEVVPEAPPEAAPEALPPSAASSEVPIASPGSTSSSCSSPPELSSAPPAAAAEPGRAEAVLRGDGSAPARLAARTVRVQQARSVPVVPPKPQFAKVPPALQPWLPAEDGASSPPPQLRSSPAAAAAEEPAGSAGGRRAAWREGVSLSFDAAVAVAAEQQLAPAPVRRIQTYAGGSGELAAAARALPFHTAPLRPRRLRPLSCAAAAEGQGPPRSRLSLPRPAAQSEAGAAVPPGRRAEGSER
ncbi:LOW QUALITY PROTEIN: rho GTPase-activating protein 30 [Pogoniulus pusillus]